MATPTAGSTSPFRVIMSAHPGAYIHSFRRRKEIKKGKKTRWGWMNGGLILQFGVSDFVRVHFDIRQWEMGYMGFSVLGSGLARIGTSEGLSNTRSETFFSIGRGIRAGVQVSGAIMVAHWEKIHRHGVESFWEYPPSTHGYGVCFHFRQSSVRYPWGKARADGVA